MRLRTRPLRWLLVVVCGVLGSTSSAPVRGVEPARQFLEALRAAGYTDVALEYLEKAANSPLVAVEFRELVPYERGVTLVEASKKQRDPAIRDKNLDEAEQALRQFVNGLPDHPLAQAANNQLGNLLVERGRSRLDRAKRVADPKPLQDEARALFDNAYVTFTQAQTVLLDKLTVLNKRVYNPETDQDKIEEREQLRTDYLQSMLLAAAVLEEKADTLGDKDPKFAETLTKAAAEYEQIYEKYRTRMAGLYARMYQGRCSMKMGKYDDALSYFSDLLDAPDESDAARRLEVKALNYAIDCWLALKKQAEAARRGLDLAKTVRRTEERDDDWLELRIKTAVATKAYADTKPNDPELKKMIADARSLIEPLAKFKSDYQEQARKLVVELRGGDASQLADTERPEPTTFVEARDAGREQIEAQQTALLVLSAVPARLAREQDPEQKKELQQQLDEAQQTKAEATGKALGYFEKALALVTPETPSDDVNTVRYYVCYLKFQSEQYPEAAVVGEFVTRRYPGSAGARPCAKIALFSYLKIAGSPPGEFESGRIVGISNYILEKWPDQPEAEEALRTLIPFMIREGNLDKAQEYVEQIPEASPRRGDAELMTGQALWQEYLRRMSEIRAAEAAGTPAPTSDDVVQLRTRAQQVLENGVARMEKVGLSDQLVSAAISLSQIYVDTSQAAKAVAMLENPQFGPIKLADEKHPATVREGVAGEVYKTALRAYIASLAGGGDPASSMGKAKEMMTKLKESVGTDADGMKKLIAIYVSLARDLRQQIDLADAATKPALWAGFETFLGQVGQESNEFTVLNWVAETFRGTLGESNLGPNGQVTPEAKRYFGEASKAYDRLLSLAGQDPQFLPNPALKGHLLMQQALTQRQLGEFDKALAILGDMLKEKASNVSAQIEAARTYQEWGAYPGQEAQFVAAMGGAMPQGTAKQNLIWGWAKLAKITATNEQFKDVFYESRYNLSLCYFRYGLAKSGDEQKKLVEKARDSIQYLVKLYPEMGGDAWRKQFDDLLRQIQRKLGETETGLQ